MAYVITESCIGTSLQSCRDADGGFPCVEACPVDGIYGRPGDPQLYTNGDECIDCADCYVECPVAAIFVDCDVPAEVRALNTDNYARVTSQPTAA
jgi:NAD-dependent dihydropyrimidine dehydrogenase PreA subunit